MQGSTGYRSAKVSGALYSARLQVGWFQIVGPSIADSDREGDRIVLEGEADQVPDHTPGDIVFELVETPHKIFRRLGADLTADLDITLAEALCGFSRVVIKHLDGRGLHINHPHERILRPGHVIKIAGEGMPMKKSELKGDLYLTTRVKFPEDGWPQDGALLTTLQQILPKPAEIIVADTIDEVDYDEAANMDDFGGEAASGEAWEDDDDDNDEGNPQCAQQ